MTQVSVIVTNYNYARFLEECVASVLSQTYILAASVLTAAIVLLCRALRPAKSLRPPVKDEIKRNRHD